MLRATSAAHSPAAATYAVHNEVGVKVEHECCVQNQQQLPAATRLQGGNG
jgi:hypothetical protein